MSSPNKFSLFDGGLIDKTIKMTLKQRQERRNLGVLSEIETAMYQTSKSNVSVFKKSEPEPEKTQCATDNKVDHLHLT